MKIKLIHFKNLKNQIESFKNLEIKLIIKPKYIQ